MKMLKTPLTVGAAIVLCSTAHAQVYWDINGTVTGATDGTDASGTWDLATTSNWNTASDGTGTVTTFTDGDAVVFSAGSTTATATITISGSPYTSSLTIEEGDYIFDGNLSLGTDYTVSSGASATFNDFVTLTENPTSFVIDGDSTMNIVGGGKYITKTGTGTLTLTDSNNSDYGINANEGLTVIARTTTKQLKSVTVGSSGTLQLSSSEQLSYLTVNGTFIMDDNVTDTLNQLSGSGLIQAGENTSLSITSKDSSFSGTITGDLDLNLTVSSFSLSDGSSMEFVISGDGDSNSITGTSTLSLAGEFTFDLTEADLTEGNSWLIVDVASLDETYSSTFSILDFTESDGIWTYDYNALLQFSEATGYLTVVPEPSTYALLAGCFGMAFVMVRRRQ
jgi:hypothetical protein